MLTIRPFTTADIPAGMRLKSEAGWNQIAADWERMLAMQPEGCLIAEVNGAPAGTVMSCIFGEVAWIAMMLVDSQLRGRGIGRALMERALTFLDERGVRTVRLDATPLGRPLYEKLGFVPQYTLVRYGGVPQGRPAGGTTRVVAAAPEHREAISALDRAVTRTDRSKLLARLLAERPGGVVPGENGLGGFVLERLGSRATQIGPCIADDQAGPHLLNEVLARHPMPVYLDIPQSHEPAATLAQRHGLVVERELLRMCLGEPLCEETQRLWSSSGPELG